MTRYYKPRKSKRRYKKKNKKLTMNKQLNYNMHSFKRSWNIFTLSNTSSNFGGHVSLDQLINYTEFTALYDYYSIVGVKYVFIPQQNNLEQTTTGTQIPYLYHCVDKDGSGPTTESQFLERGKTPITLNRMRKFYLKYPKVRMSVDDGGTSFPAMQSNTNKIQWIDAGSPSVDFYGMYFLVSGTRVAGWSCKVMATYYLRFKGPR